MSGDDRIGRQSDSFHAVELMFRLSRQQCCVAHFSRPVNVTRTLLGTYLFQDLNAAQVDAIAARASVEHFARGDHVFRDGDPANEIYILASGQIREYSVDQYGNEYVSELFSPGAVIGEPGAFSRERTRVVNEVVIARSEVIRIPRDDLLQFVIAHPPALVRLLEGLASEARGAIRDVASLQHEDVRARVVRRLVVLAQTHGLKDESGAIQIDLRFTQSELASMVGCTRENVNRVIATLCDEQLVQVDGRRMLVIDLSRLQRDRTEQGDGMLLRRNRRIDSS